jgi:deazaflavin-dependent oxidoreductase (nitroreductase family)
MARDFREVNRGVIEAFRAGGDIPGMHRDRLLLLTTIGARSGERRTTPMMRLRDGDRVVVVASNNGAKTDPQWYRNLLANPHVTVEVGQEAFEATAQPLTGDERERVWSAIKAANPFFAGYEAKVDRTIPVVALVRVGGG